MIAYSINRFAASLVLLTFTAAATNSTTTPCTVSKTTYTTETDVSVDFIYETISTTYYYNTTTTVAPTTTTNLPPPDFTPIRSEIVDQGYTPSKRDLSGNALRWLAQRALNTTTTATKKKPPTYGTATPKSYKTTTKASSSAKVTSTKGSATSTLKTTTRKLSSPTPVPSTTSCFTTTITNTDTVTTTSPYTETFTSASFVTNTYTVSAAVATYYPACETSNQLSRVETLDVNPDATFYQQGYDGVLVDTAHDCCIQAVSGGYAFSAFNIDASRLGECRLFYNTQANGVCSANGTTHGMYFYPNGEPRYTLSNGYCGHFVYGGVAGEPSIAPPKATQTA